MTLYQSHRDIPPYRPAVYPKVRAPRAEVIRFPRPEAESVPATSNPTYLEFVSGDFDQNVTGRVG